jgi:hypothetical protein
MKDHINLICKTFLLILAVSINGKAPAQVYLPAKSADFLNNYHEKLLINTDRDLYITGEVVWLKVYKLNGLSGTPSDISKIVYLELLDNSNNAVSQVKIWVNGSSGSTGFRLADTLSSGNYLIRAYTKWMLNYSENLFFYKTLTVLNPFKNFQQLINTSGQPNPVSDFTSLKATQEAERLIKKENRINIRIEPLKKEYLSRDKVRLDISVTDPNGKPVETDMSVSVIKPAMANMERMSIFHRFDTPKEAGSLKANYTFRNTGAGDNSDSVKYDNGSFQGYLPEIEGPLLGGTIKNKTTGEPLKNIDISLSLVGKTARCQFVQTNEKGEFYFVLRQQIGLSQIVIQPLSGELTDYYVELSQPFCNTFSDNKPEILYLDSTKTRIINQAIISMQVNNIYEPFRKNKLVRSSNDINSNFFGKPDRRINMSDYIELKNVREIVKELLTEIMVIKKNKKFHLKIINSYPFQPFENQALILVDGIPVNDIENLLNVSSKELERIDIINRRYFFSDYVFDGILSFVSKKGDMSALETDNPAYRQVLEGYKPQYTFYSTDYSIDSLKKSHIPDFRNTLYWNPDVKSSKDGKVAVEFYTSDETGQFAIVIEGISSTGNAGFYTIPLLVR